MQKNFMKITGNKNYTTVDLYEIAHDYGDATLLLENIGAEGENYFRIVGEFSCLDDLEEFLYRLDGSETIDIPTEMIISTPDYEDGGLDFFVVREGEIMTNPYWFDIVDDLSFVDGYNDDISEYLIYFNNELDDEEDYILSDLLRR